MHNVWRTTSKAPSSTTRRLYFARPTRSTCASCLSRHLALPSSTPPGITGAQKGDHPHPHHPRLHPDLLPHHRCGAPWRGSHRQPRMCCVEALACGTESTQTSMRTRRRDTWGSASHLASAVSAVDPAACCSACCWAVCHRCRTDDQSQTCQRASAPCSRNSAYAARTCCSCIWGTSSPLAQDEDSRPSGGAAQAKDPAAERDPRAAFQAYPCSTPQTHSFELEIVSSPANPPGRPGRPDHLPSPSRRPSPSHPLVPYHHRHPPTAAADVRRNPRFWHADVSE